MPGRNTTFANGEYYHIYNRGSDKRDIFLNRRDFVRFQRTFYYYQFVGPKPKFSNNARYKHESLCPMGDNQIVEIHCYCLMPNHFHFLIRQLKDNGISHFMSQVCNSYTKYFNTKHNRVGPLLQGAFKATYIESDEQLVHISRYIHLNPYVSGLIKSVEQYPWSSLAEYIHANGQLCRLDEILGRFASTAQYRAFVHANAEYGLSLELIKHSLIEEE